MKFDEWLTNEPPEKERTFVECPGCHELIDEADICKGGTCKACHETNDCFCIAEYDCPDCEGTGLADDSHPELHCPTCKGRGTLPDEVA